MTTTIPDDHTKLLSSISNFLNITNTDHRHTLHEFQALVSYVNWALNVYILGRPGLSTLYSKIAGKTKPNAHIYLNITIIYKLRWLSNYIMSAPPLHIFSPVFWDPLEACVAGLHQLDVFTDASPVGLAYYFPSLDLAYHTPLPPNPPSDTIFWFEALAIRSTIDHAADVYVCNFSPKLNRLLVSTDSMDSICMFNSCHAKPSYKTLLISSIDVHICSSLDVHVRHIARKDNTITNTISRKKFTLALWLIPNLTILTFTPPRDALGASPQ